MSLLQVVSGGGGESVQEITIWGTKVKVIERVANVHLYFYKFEHSIST